MTAADLARLALETLDAQRAYFDAKGGTAEKFSALERAKRLEKQLRVAAEAALDVQPKLFDA